MDAHTSKFLTLLGADRAQFVIPIYQRPYSWTNVQCDALWEDVIMAGRFGRSHFIGSFLYVNVDEDTPVTQIRKLYLIDGQQRMTTLSLMLAAFFDWVDEDPSRSDFLTDVPMEDLRRAYLYKGERYSNDSAYRLVLAEDDRDTLFAILGHHLLPEKRSERIVANYELFEHKLRAEDFNPSELWQGLDRLEIIDVPLKLETDNPQLVFESMNSKGLPLTPIDLIRNFILMSKPLDEQNALYQRYWHRIEGTFGPDGTEDFNAFVWYWLTLKSRYATHEGAIYEDFKRYYDSVGGEVDTEALLADLMEYASYYSQLFMGKERNQNLASCFSRLDGLGIRPARLLLLALYAVYAKGNLSAEDLAATCTTLESYLFRRIVVGRYSTGLNRFLTPIAKRVENADNPREFVIATLLGQRRQSSMWFPNDDAFSEALQSRDLYNRFRNAKYLLERIEHWHQPNEPLGSLQIEHIMPRSIDSAIEWQEMLGDDWERIHDELCNTLGNLTLTGYNQQYSNSSFETKLTLPDHGFLASPLYLNKSVRECEVWNAETIEQRARELVKDAIKIWARPTLPKYVIRANVPNFEVKQSHNAMRSTGDPKLDAVISECSNRTEGIAPYEVHDHGFTASQFGRYGIEKADWLTRPMSKKGIYLVGYQLNGIPFYYWRSQDGDGMVTCHARVMVELVSLPEDVDLESVARLAPTYYEAPSFEFDADRLCAMIDDLARALRDAIEKVGGTAPSEDESFELNLPADFIDASKAGPTELQQLQVAYWGTYRELAKNDAAFSSVFKARRAAPQHWSSLSVGSSKFHLSLLTNTPKCIVGVEIYVDDDFSIGHALRDALPELDAAVGLPGEYFEGDKASGIRYFRERCDIKGQPELWPDFIHWQLETAVALRAVLARTGFIAG